MDNPYVAVTGLGFATGETLITNDDVAWIIRQANEDKKRASSGESLSEAELKNIVTDDAWIRTRTGISQRYYTCSSTSQLAARAVRMAVADARRKLEDIDAIIVATVSPDHLYSPPTGCLVHRELGISIRNELGLKNFFTVDVSDACSSFGAGLILGHSLVASGKYKFVVVVGSDRMSTAIDPSDRMFSALLGDAAGAMVLEATDDAAKDSFPWGTKSFFFGTDPAGADNIIASCGGSAEPLTIEALQEAESTLGKVRPDKLMQIGSKVFKEMINFVPGMTEEAIKPAGLTLSNIDMLFPHQANLRMNEPIEERLRERGFRGTVWNTIQRFGNTTSAALPLGLETAWNSYELVPGMTLALVPFGGGYTYGCILIRWTAEPFYFA